MTYGVRHQKVNTLCRIDVRCMSYCHWANTMSGTGRCCYCSYGLAHNM